MTKSKGIGKGKGGGPKPKGLPIARFSMAISGPRLADYREYLELKEGRPVTDKEVIQWVRSGFHAYMDGLDSLVEREKESALIF